MGRNRSVNGEKWKVGSGIRMGGAVRRYTEWGMGSGACETKKMGLEDKTWESLWRNTGTNLSMSQFEMKISSDHLPSKLIT